jgi:hypothetical protein
MRSHASYERTRANASRTRQASDKQSSGRQRIRGTHEAKWDQTELTWHQRRRAQVRNAQRTYQKRKDTASASVNNRCDELLQLLLDLSTDIESLLQAGAKSGRLEHTDDFADRLRKLWDSYDVVINKPCVSPELTLLQIKNGRRRADYQRQDIFRVGVSHGKADRTRSSSSPLNGPDTDTSSPDMELVRVSEGTLIQPFKQSRDLGGRSILEIVKQRQAQLHVPNADNTNNNQPDMELVRVSEGTVLQPFGQSRSDSSLMGGRSIFDIVMDRQAEFNRSESHVP